MPKSPNPLTESSAAEAEDIECVRLAKSGSREALERLIVRHQAWIYNIAVRMLYYPQEAEDATQEILIKVITKLSTFEGRSSFRTWLYRLAVNHVLNLKRRDWEDRLDFAKYGRDLDDTPDLDLPDPRAVPADVALMVDEARIGCTSGMLLCLDREQRLVYILGEIFGVTDAVGAEILDTTRDAFRQKLARARRDLHAFLQNQCGLVNTANPCRCAKKTQGFAKAGFLNPEKLLFARERIIRVREVAASKIADLAALGRKALEQYVAPFAGKISIERVEMIDPTVYRVGDLAVLTFNLVDYGGQFNGGPKATSRWNTTEVYQRIDGKWKIVHSHWSYTKPK